MKSMKFVLYYLFIVIIGGLVLLFGIFEASHSSLFLLIGYMLLAIFIESLAVRIEQDYYISLGFALGLCVVIVFPPTVAALIVFSGALFNINFRNGKVVHVFNSSIKQRLFNGGADTIVAFVSGYVYRMHYGVLPKLMLEGVSFFSVLLASMVYIVLNILIFSMLFSILARRCFWDVVKRNIWVFKNFVTIAPIGILMALAQLQFGFLATLIFVLPFTLVRYAFVQYIQIKHMSTQIIDAFSQAIDAKDKYTVGHSSRVSDYAEQLAKYMTLPSRQVEKIKSAALLHDIGKIGIPDYILNKPGKLSSEEYSEIMRHSEIGYDIIKKIDALSDLSLIIKYHHEYYDGTGYPDGIKGDEIPLESSIISVVDAYDAMTSDRSYRKALSQQAAIEILNQEVGRQFHPDVVAYFIEMIKNKS